MNDTIDLKKIDGSDAPDKVKEVYRFLKRYMDQPERKAWLKMRQELHDAVYESAIWTEEEKAQMLKKDMIPLTINDLYKGVQGSAAVVTDQKPGVEFLPVGSGDLYVAELMKRAHDQVWAQNDGGTELYEFVKEAKIAGLPCIDVKHDPAKGIYGKVVIGNFDPETLYFDMQKCRKADLSDVTVIKAHLVSKTYCKETYEDIKDEDLAFEGVQKPDTDAKTDTVTGADNYTKGAKDDVPAGPDDYPEEKDEIWEIEAHILKRDKEIWLMVPDGQGGYAREVFEIGEKADAEERAVNIQGSLIWARTVEKRYLRIVVGKKLIPQRQGETEVDEVPNAYGVDVDGDPILPIIAMIHEKSRKGKPVSPTVFAKEACRERNKRRAQAIYVVTKNIDAPIQMPESAKWVKDPVHGDFIRIGKDAPCSNSSPPGSTSNEALNLEAVAKADVDDMYDMHDVMKGKFPPGRPAMGSVFALIDQGGMMSKPFTRSLEAALVRLGKVTMACILRNWPRAMWERLIEPDEWKTWEPAEQKPQESAVDALNQLGQPKDTGQNDEKQQEIAQKWQAALELLRPTDMAKEPGINLMDVDVRVAAGSTMPTNRAAKQQMAIELYAGGKGIYDRQAALDYVDDPKKDQVIARMQAQEEKMMLMSASGAQMPSQ